MYIHLAFRIATRLFPRPLSTLLFSFHITKLLCKVLLHVMTLFSWKKKYTITRPESLVYAMRVIYLPSRMPTYKENQGSLLMPFNLNALVTSHSIHTLFAAS